MDVKDMEKLERDVNKVKTAVSRMLGNVFSFYYDQDYGAIEVQGSELNVLRLFYKLDSADMIRLRVTKIYNDWVLLIDISDSKNRKYFRL